MGISSYMVYYGTAKFRLRLITDFRRDYPLNFRAWRRKIRLLITCLFRDFLRNILKLQIVNIYAYVVDRFASFLSLASEEPPIYTFTSSNNLVLIYNTPRLNNWIKCYECLEIALKLFPQLNFNMFLYFTLPNISSHKIIRVEGFKLRRVRLY